MLCPLVILTIQPFTVCLQAAVISFDLKNSEVLEYLSDPKLLFIIRVLVLQGIIKTLLKE